MYAKIINSVVENKEVVSIERDNDYKFNKFLLKSELNASDLSLCDIENISDIEMKLYEYIENQGLELTSGNEEFTTSFISHPIYKGINIEGYLLKAEKSNERLFSLAHEIGHFLDLKFNHNNDADLFCMWYEENCIAMEVVAWKYGWKVLESLGCDLKIDYVSLAVDCLSSYTESTEKAINMLMKSNDIVKEYENKCKEPLVIEC